jgi:transposase
MARYVEGSDRSQVMLLPECLEDWIAEDNPVRAVDAFVEELDLAAMGFERATPASTGRPSYHPAALLKIYIYGYLNRWRPPTARSRSKRKPRRGAWARRLRACAAV